jgi:hypothetical protein
MGLWNKLVRLSRRNVLRVAGMCAARGWIPAARVLIRYLAPPVVFHDSHLALANMAVDDAAQWSKLVNAYFASNNLSEINLTEDANPSYFTLGSPASKSVEQEPKVSVIMSAFNAERYIAASIRSILGQSWQNIELLVVDDCSTDATTQVVEDLARSDERIRLIRSPVNAGTYVCRNLAFDHCAGEFVTTQDSDDWSHPERIRIQAQYLISNPELPANMSCNVRMSEDGHFELTSFGTYTTYRCCASLMIRARVVKSMFGYWDSVRVSADNEYIERMLTVLGPQAVKIISQPLMIQLRRENSLTTNPLTLGANGRLSLARQKYQEAYLTWHKSLHAQNCALPFPVEKREFFAPEEILVPYSSVLRVFGLTKSDKSLSELGGGETGV